MSPDPQVPNELLVQKVPEQQLLLVEVHALPCGMQELGAWQKQPVAVLVQSMRLLFASVV